MVSLKNKKGFTIVELLIVIVVIGILATLVIVTFTGIQQKGRNTQRKTDINAITSHVEAFYAETGSYPTYAQLADAGWRGINTKGLKEDALIDPKGGTAILTNDAGDTTHYGYTSLNEAGTACGVLDATATLTTGDQTTDCASFVLTATLEDNKATHDTYTKSSN